eukprot:751549-Hanusia_phi.AAC.1
MDDTQEGTRTIYYSGVLVENDNYMFYRNIQPLVKGRSKLACSFELPRLAGPGTRHEGFSSQGDGTEEETETRLARRVDSEKVLVAPPSNAMVLLEVDPRSDPSGKSWRLYAVEASRFKQLLVARYPTIVVKRD